MPVHTAAGVTTALKIMTAHTVGDAASRSRWRFDRQDADPGSTELHSCPVDGDVSAAIAIAASCPLLGPGSQLRYRISCPVADYR